MSKTVNMKGARWSVARCERSLFEVRVVSHSSFERSTNSPNYTHPSPARYHSATDGRLLRLSKQGVRAPVTSNRRTMYERGIRQYQQRLSFVSGDVKLDAFFSWPLEKHPRIEQLCPFVCFRQRAIRFRHLVSFASHFEVVLNVHMFTDNEECICQSCQR